MSKDSRFAYGGWQIEYEHEDPEIRQSFGAECAKSGALVKVPNLR